MRANDHVYFTCLNLLHHFLLLLRGSEARQQFDLHRKRSEARAERVVVLISEHCGWRENRRLLSFHHRLERSAHCYFGLAITDVAAQETVHWHRLFHVFLDVLNRRFLVGSEHESKTIFKLLLPRRIGRERVTADEFSFRVKTQQLVGHVAHGALCFGLRLLPAETTQSIELRLMTFSARISLHE